MESSNAKTNVLCETWKNVSYCDLFKPLNDSSLVEKKEEWGLVTLMLIWDSDEPFLIKDLPDKGLKINVFRPVVNASGKPEPAIRFEFISDSILTDEPKQIFYDEMKSTLILRRTIYGRRGDLTTSRSFTIQIPMHETPSQTHRDIRTFLYDHFRSAGP
jgi:hypothetical protein